MLKPKLSDKWKDTKITKLAYMQIITKVIANTK